jgi:hypothetical protein
MHTDGRDRDRVSGQTRRQLSAVRSMRDTADDHGIDLELEAQRSHDNDGSAAGAGLNRAAS